MWSQHRTSRRSKKNCRTTTPASSVDRCTTTPSVGLEGRAICVTDRQGQESFVGTEYRATCQGRRTACDAVPHRALKGKSCRRSVGWKTSTRAANIHPLAHREWGRRQSARADLHGTIPSREECREASGPRISATRLAARLRAWARRQGEATERVPNEWHLTRLVYRR